MAQQFTSHRRLAPGNWPGVVGCSAQGPRHLQERVVTPARSGGLLACGCLHSIRGASLSATTASSGSSCHWTPAFSDGALQRCCVQNSWHHRGSQVVCSSLSQVLEPSSTTSPSPAPSYTKAELESMKVSELQELLANLGAPKSGKKAVLVDRLLALLESGKGHIPSASSNGHAATQEEGYSYHVSVIDDGAAGHRVHVQIGGEVEQPAKTTRGRRRKSASAEQQAGSDTAAPKSARGRSPRKQSKKAGDEASTSSTLDGTHSGLTAEAGTQQQQDSMGHSSSHLLHSQQAGSHHLDLTSATSHQVHTASPSAFRTQTDTARRLVDEEEEGLVDEPAPEDEEEQYIAEDEAEEEYPLVPEEILETLPPIPVLRRGRSWAAHDTDLPDEEVRAIIQSIPSDLQLAVLGTAAIQPSPTRALASVAICRSKDVWLFEAGDDTQRQLGAVPHIKPSKMYRVFISCLSAETLMGLPGLLCSMNSARAKGHESVDIPIHIYGPEGLADFLAPIFKVSNTYFEVPMLVVEFAQRAVTAEESEPQLYSRRARMWRVLVPPDQLNPEGYFDGDLAAFMPTQGRANIRRGAKASGGVLTYDMRAGFLPFPEPVPGDPDATVEVQEMRWTIQADVSARLTAVALPSPGKPTFAFAFQEADRAGQVVVERARALGISPGVKLKMLKDGESVEGMDGYVVTPDMVLTPDKPGRRIVIMGNAHALPTPQSAFAEVAQEADLLVSGWVDTFPLQGSSELFSDPGFGLSDSCLQAAQVGNMAARLGVHHLLLARFSTPVWWLSPDEDDEAAIAQAGTEEHVERALQQAVEAVAAARAHLPAREEGEQQPPATRVDAAFDFWVQILEKHEGPEPAV